MNNQDYYSELPQKKVKTEASSLTSNQNNFSAELNQNNKTFNKEEKSYIDPSPMFCFDFIESIINSQAKIGNSHLGAGNVQLPFQKNHNNDSEIENFPPRNTQQNDNKTSTVYTDINHNYKKIELVSIYIKE